MPKLRKGEVPNSVRHIRRLSKDQVGRDVSKIFGEGSLSQVINDPLNKDDNAVNFECNLNEEYLLTQDNNTEQDNIICYIKKLNLERINEENNENDFFFFYKVIEQVQIE